jgi:glycosyltransferase involved in cell wall biosynthesis
MVMEESASSPVYVSVVTPVRNAMRYLPQTVPAVLQAAGTTGGVEIIYVDNGSTDGSYEYLAAITGCRVQRREKVSISALRNLGASQARGEYLSFLDADCSIGPRYFDEAIAVMQSSTAAATGFEVQTPPAPHWIEAAWHDLHASGADRDVEWINSGNFFISRAIFLRIGGFREDLRTGEDAEIGQRLTSAGYRLWASHRVAAIHIGNPKSIREFYRRSVWHGLGMFGTVKRDRIDKPTAMMFVHLLATIAGLFVLIAAQFSWPVRALVALLLQLAVPSLTVAYRAWRVRRLMDVPRGVFLYWLYYWARLEALVRVIAGHGDKYFK